MGTSRANCEYLRLGGAYGARETKRGLPSTFQATVLVKCSSGLFEGLASIIEEVSQGTLAGGFLTSCGIEQLNRSVGLGYGILAACASCPVYSSTRPWTPVAHNCPCCGCSCFLQC